VTESAVDIAAMQALLASWQRGPFIFSSSLDVYGLGGSELITEDTPVTETYNDYSRGKVVCERLLADAAARSGRTDHVSLRAPHIWGPHPTARRRLVSPRRQDHRSIVRPGRDRAEWSRYQDVWIDARDLATIVAECVTRPAGGPLNVLTGHFIWHDLQVELIRSMGSRSELLHKPVEEISDDELPNKHIYAQTWQFSEARLARHLGTIPRRSFALTVRETILPHARSGGHMSAKVYRGSCFCGTIEITVSGEPVAMGFCHCTSCRTWSASPLNAFSLWRPEAVRITKGWSQLATYNKTRKSFRKWCTTCGGHLLTEHPTLELRCLPRRFPVSISRGRP
jgi:hypothetical protein